MKLSKVRCFNRYEWHQYQSDGTYKLHREDGPAIEYDSGSKVYYVNGLHHRVGGPAVHLSDGTKFWYLNGQLHRGDGPAVEHSNGEKYWYKNGELHRENGPAIEFADGRKEYWLHSRRILTEEEKHNAESLIKENASTLI